MKAIITVCSKRKDTSPGMLPAHKRYQGAHVERVRKIAEEQEIPFFILSGKHGLIPANKPVEYYDYRLDDQGVKTLIRLVKKQIGAFGITSIDFYTEGKLSWAPYRDALALAAKCRASINPFLLL